MKTLQKFVIDLILSQKKVNTGKCEKYNAGFILGLSMAQGCVATHCKECRNEYQGK